MIYVAAPWFTERQALILEQTKEILKKYGLKVYSPKDEMLFKPGGVFSPREIYQSNILAIQSASLVVVITDGKDVGTIFEAGYAARAGIPIIYLWVDHDYSNFNIMLAQSGLKCCLGFEKFEEAMELYSETGKILRTPYEGAVE